MDVDTEYYTMYRSMSIPTTDAGRLTGKKDKYRHSRVNGHRSGFHK